MSTEIGQTTTISISVSEKNRLDRMKLHRREPYSEVIKRVLDDIDKLVQSGVKLPSLVTSPRSSYQSYIKAMIDSTTKNSNESL